VQLLFELLDEARTPAERATAISVGAQSVEPLLGRYFMHHAHLAVRGGTRALLRELLAEPKGSVLRQLADEAVARNGDRGIALVRAATTRADWSDDSRIMTIETGGSVGDIELSADGQHVRAFVSGGCAWDLEVCEHSSSWLGHWSLETGELRSVASVGQFRDDNGDFAVNPSGTLLAVQSHRGTHLHAIDPVTLCVNPRKPRKLDGRENPHAACFIDDTTLIVNDAGMLVVFDTESEQARACVDAIGYYTACPTLAGDRVFVGGAGVWHDAIAEYDLHTLDLLSVCVADDAGPTRRLGSPIDSLALAPSQQLTIDGQCFVFDSNAALLRREPLVPAPRPYPPTVSVRGSATSELDVRAIAQPIEDDSDAPALEVRQAGERIDSVVLEATPLACGWLDARTFVVFDAAGHLTCWARR
jgi:hypothetical protein